MRKIFAGYLLKGKKACKFIDAYYPKTHCSARSFPGIADSLDQKHPLYLLANTIKWSVFDQAFKEHYSETMGAPSKPIRLMGSVLILKYIGNLSDENLVEQWSENCYYQYLSGEQTFQPKIPCVPTELVAFRKRIGEAGVELILKESIR